MNLKNLLWIALAAVIVIGGLFWVQGDQQTQPEEGVGGGPGNLMQQESIEIPLNVVENEEQINQTGTATLSGSNGRVTVTLDLNEVEGLDNQPAHIHAGSCPGVGSILFPLNNVVNGRSVTELNTSLEQLMSEPMAINIHKSAEEMSVYTSCGELSF